MEEIKRDLKRELEIKKQWTSSHKTMAIAFVVLLFFILIFAGFYYVYIYRIPCYDSECFSKSLANCEGADWVREDEQAIWVYSIVKENGKDSCIINVKLIDLKKGPEENAVLIGQSMDCIMLKSETRFPEQDLSNCHGYLKESIQDLIIKKIYGSVLENLGDIKKEFNLESIS